MTLDIKWMLHILHVVKKKLIIRAMVHMSHVLKDSAVVIVTERNVAGDKMLWCKRVMTRMMSLK